MTEGYQVASVGGDALRRVAEDLPDLVLLDLRLPDTLASTCSR
jgi:CheY-like chemotaxis protein